MLKQNMQAQALPKVIEGLGFKTQKEFAEYFGYSPQELSRHLNSDKPLPARLRNIVECHERTKEILLDKLQT